MKRYYLIYYSHLRAIAIALILLSCSCSKEEPIEPEPEPNRPNRTILYYLGTDNNLQVEADEKIEAMRLGFPGGDNKLVIYKDISNEAPQLIEVYQDETGENLIRTVKTYPEQNSARGETFQTVLHDVKLRFEADSYGLILFSHASGWLPAGALLRPEAAILQMGLAPIRTYTVAMDGNTELGLAEFADAIPDHFFEFIAFEACFMAGIEVLYELKDKTDYIVGSSAEMVSPGFVPVFPESLPLLFEPQADLVGFARNYFDYWNSQNGDYRSATITVAKTNGLTQLAAWVKQHANAEIAPEMLPEIQHFDRYRNHRLFFDFEDYYRRKAPGATSDLTTLLENIVVYKAATPRFIPSQLGFEINNHSGLTTYVPQARFPNLNDRYGGFAWAAAVE